MPAVLPLSILSAAAQARLKAPRTRGAVLPVEAARRQLALLSVGDDGGQGHLYWLVDPATQVIEDSRFLAFGGLWSHPFLDAFTELCRGNTVAAACALSATQVESLLRDDPLTPAFPEQDAAAAALADLQAKALAAVPGLVLLPRPADAPTYVRKRRQDWNADDQTWLPLGLMQKMQRVQEVADRLLASRFADRAVRIEITGLHDDFQVHALFPGLDPSATPTAAAFVQEALGGQLHPGLRVAVD